MMEISPMKTPNLPITSPSGEAEATSGTDAIEAAAAADFQEMLQVLMQGAPPDDPTATGIVPPGVSAATGQAEEEHAAMIPGIDELLPAPVLVPALAPSFAAAATRATSRSDDPAIATDGVSAKLDTAANAVPMSGIRAHPRLITTPDAPIGDSSDLVAKNADMTANLPAVSLRDFPTQQTDSAAANSNASGTALLIPLASLGTRSIDHAVVSPASQMRLESPLGTTDWSGEFAQKVMWIAGDRQQSAELHLNPPELGPLSIRLAIDDDQTSAVFHSTHSEVREAIQAALPRLREVLAENGIALGNASVTADSPHDGSAFDRKHPPQSYASSNATGTVADDPAVTHPRSNGSGLVNLFA